MTADTILLRPLGPAQSRRVAVVLGVLFCAVVAMGWLAAGSLTPAPAPLAAPAPSSAPRPAVRAAANMLPPATVVAFHPYIEDGRMVPGKLLDESAQATLAGWAGMLRARPGSRVRLTLTSAESTSEEQQQRVGAALVRLLAAEDVDPHRILLVLAPAVASALSPGDFRASIELGAP